MEKKAWQKETWIGSGWVWRKPRQDTPILIALPRVFPFPFQSKSLWDRGDPDERIERLGGYGAEVLGAIGRWRKRVRPEKFEWPGKKAWESWNGPGKLVWSREKRPGIQFPESSFVAWNSWLKVGILTENTGRFDPLRMGFGLLVLLRGENGKFPEPSLVGYWACRLAVWAYAANLVWLLAPHLRKDLDLLVGMWGEGRIGWETLVQRTEELACRAKSWAARGREARKGSKIIPIEELRAKASGTGG
jgi:hypothetical protein